MLEVEELRRAIGKVGWVSPSGRKSRNTCRIAVKVIGVNYAYGKFLYRVEPLAGVGSWQIECDRLELDRERGS